MEDINIQEVKADKVEFVDLYIPIYRYKGTGNYWSIMGCYLSKEEAVEVIKGMSNLADAKILHHAEKFVYETGEDHF